MRSKFYEFFKIDERYRGKSGDFSAAYGTGLTDEEKIEFLSKYSAYLEKKNGKTRKVLTPEETEAGLKKVNYAVPHKVRKRIEVKEATIRTYEKPQSYEGWQFYQNVKEEKGSLVLTDGIIPPVPCAKFEFSAKNFSSLEFSFRVDKDFVIEEKAAKKDKPLTTDTGRIIELRKGVTEVIKLQIYRNGEIYARVGVPDPYHHKDFKIGEFVGEETNSVKIIFSCDKYKVIYNGKEAGEFEQTNKVCPDTLFVSGGMHPAGEWRFTPERITADGKEITDFFVKAKEKNSEKTNPETVTLPYKLGGERNKDRVIELTKTFCYEKGRAVLNIGSLDPSGEVYVNGKLAIKTNDFTAQKADITGLLKPGENELKLLVFPRAPEVNYSWHRNKDPYIAWLVRDVYIDFYCGAAIENLVVKTRDVKNGRVKAEISFDILNSEKDLKVNVYLSKSPDGKETPIYAGEAEERIKKELEFEAEAWDTDNPALYIVRAEMVKDGTPVDDEVTETGFRTIEQKDGEILLNGKRILLNGALWMQFLPPYENIVLSHVCPTTEEIVEETLLTKAMNGNVARFHFLGYGGNDPRYAEVCDRLGLMNIWTTRLIDSAETTDVNRGWMAGEEYVREMREVINHPSIIMWEGSNEFHSSRAVLDKLYDEFVTKVKTADDTRLICPVSHLYYGGGLYGNEGFYYQDDGKADQDFNAMESSYGWRDESVVRSSHNYEILLGYGNRWDTFRKQDWKSQPALLSSKKHAYIISEFAVIGRQDDTTPECKEYVKTDSYELADEKRAFGTAYDGLDFKLSQAYQALCAYNTVKYMRYLGADGLMWCCLSGGANDGSYLKPPIDFYGYAKQAFYALKEGYQKTICFDKKVGVVYGGKYLCEPVVTGAETGKRYRVIAEIKDENGECEYVKEYEVAATAFTFDLEPFEARLTNGYYSIEFTVEE